MEEDDNSVTAYVEGTNGEILEAVLDKDTGV